MFFWTWKFWFQNHYTRWNQCNLKSKFHKNKLRIWHFLLNDLNSICVWDLVKKTWAAGKLWMRLGGNEHNWDHFHPREIYSVLLLHGPVDFINFDVMQYFRQSELNVQIILCLFSITIDGITFRCNHNNVDTGKKIGYIQFEV